MWIYLLIINVSGLLFMLADKIKAIRHDWRISEATLMGIAAMGGSLGSLLGMYVFRHKTRHKKFTVGIPILLFIHLVLLAFLMNL